MPSLPVSKEWSHSFFQFFPVSASASSFFDSAHPHRLPLLYLLLFLAPGAGSFIILMWPFAAWAPSDTTSNSSSSFSNASLSNTTTTTAGGPYVSHLSYAVFQALYTWSGLGLMVCQSIGAVPTVPRSYIIAIFLGGQIVVQLAYYLIYVTNQDKNFQEAQSHKSLGTLIMFMLNNIMLAVHVALHVNRDGDGDKHTKKEEILEAQMMDEASTVSVASAAGEMGEEASPVDREQGQNRLPETMEETSRRAAALYETVCSNSAALLRKWKEDQQQQLGQSEGEHEEKLVKSDATLVGEEEEEAAVPAGEQNGQEEEEVIPFSERFINTVISWRRNNWAIVGLSIFTFFFGMGMRGELNRCLLGGVRG